MGIDVTTYVFHGIQIDLSTLPNDFDPFQVLEQELNNGLLIGDFDAVYDYMAGDYLVVGKKLAVIDEHDENFYPVGTIIDAESQILVNNINKKLGTEYTPSNFTTFIFNHIY